MILFDLQCASGHVFEGWFPSGEAYGKQARRGQVSCPVCGTAKVKKAPMAPKTGRAAARDGGGRAEARAQGRILKAMRELRKAVEENSEYVGNRFPEEARSIHLGEARARSIHGEASRKEAKELQDEGVPVCRIPWVPRADN